MTNIKILLLAVAFISTEGCTQLMSSNNGDGGTVLSAAAISASGASSADQAEQLAKAAELLLTAQGFEQAGSMAQASIAKDPTNLRAQFLEAILQPILLQKGMLARTQSISSIVPSVKHEYDKAIQTLTDEKSPLLKFLMDGKPDLQTESDLQEQVDATIQAIEKLRQFSIAHKDAELTAQASSLFTSGLINNYASACAIETTADLEYKVTCPPSWTLHQIKLNRADFETIEFMAAFAEIYVAVVNSYDATGALALVKKHDLEDMPSQTAFDELFSNSKFGVLRKAQQLKQIKSLGMDIVNGLNWAQANQGTACPKGASDLGYRPGMLFTGGLCLGPMYQPLITSMQAMMSEKAIPSHTKDYEADITPVVFFENPVSDLRAIGPFQFNKCDKLESVGDPTFGGIYPNKDANKVMAISNDPCEAK